MTTFDGMTRAQCPSACTADRCAISAGPICAHPCMSGLPMTLVDNADARARYAEACKTLGVKNMHEARV